MRENVPVSELAEALSMFLEERGFIIRGFSWSSSRREQIWISLPGLPYHQEIPLAVEDTHIYVCDEIIRIDAHRPDSFPSAESYARMCTLFDRVCKDCVIPKIYKNLERS